LNYFRLLGCIFLCEGIGIVAGVFTAASVRTWYLTLQKPPFNPPSWVFGPTWTVLYLLMGIALYTIWQTAEGIPEARLAFIMFFVQLVLNALWSFVFFGLRSPLWGFVDIVALWVLILLTIVLFWRISHAAAYLMVPYFFWVTFAGILNFSIWRLNASQ
jgi:benzodiazapine receptor